jgi:hypothetical protein
MLSFKKDDLVMIDDDYYVIKKGSIKRSPLHNFLKTPSGYDYSQPINIYYQESCFVQIVKWKFSSYNLVPINDLAQKQYYEEWTYKLTEEEGPLIKMDAKQCKKIKRIYISTKGRDFGIEVKKLSWRSFKTATLCAFLENGNTATCDNVAISYISSDNFQL